MSQVARAIAICAAATILASTLARTEAPPRTFRLSGRISGASGKHPVYVALWLADDFLKRPLQQVKIDPGADPVFGFDAPGGRCALSAFEDRNGNGILDMGWFGPKEPSGFWRAFTGRHKPRFDEVAVLLDRDTPHADIVLQ